MDQAESENQKLHRNQHERGDYPNHGVAMRLPYSGMDEVHILARAKPDADRTIAANESLCPTGLDGIAQTAKATTQNQPTIGVGLMR